MIVLKRLTIYLHRQSKHKEVGKTARKNCKVSRVLRTALDTSRKLNKK